MAALGFCYAIGFDLISLLPKLGLVLRAIFGLMYVLVAFFIIHYAIAYEKIKKEYSFVCHHCGHKQKDS